MVPPPEDNKRRCHACITSGKLFCDFNKFDQCNFCAASAKTHCHDNKTDTMTTFWVKQEAHGRFFPTHQPNPPAHFNALRVGPRRSIRPEFRDDNTVIETMTPAPTMLPSAPRQMQTARFQGNRRNYNDPASIYAQAELQRAQTEHVKMTMQQATQTPQAPYGYFPAPPGMFMNYPYDPMRHQQALAPLANQPPRGPRAEQGPYHAPQGVTSHNQNDEIARLREQLKAKDKREQELQAQIDRTRNDQSNDLSRLANDNQRQTRGTERDEGRVAKRKFDDSGDLFGGDIHAHRQQQRDRRAETDQSPVRETEVKRRRFDPETSFRRDEAPRRRFDPDTSFRRDERHRRRFDAGASFRQEEQPRRRFDAGASLRQDERPSRRFDPGTSFRQEERHQRRVDPDASSRQAARHRRRFGPDSSSKPDEVSGRVDPDTTVEPDKVPRRRRFEAGDSFEAEDEPRTNASPATILPTPRKTRFDIRPKDEQSRVNVHFVTGLKPPANVKPDLSLPVPRKTKFDIRPDSERQRAHPVTADVPPSTASPGLLLPALMEQTSVDINLGNKEADEQMTVLKATVTETGSTDSPGP